MFANVSHELRTPLALIIGPAQRLRRDLGEEYQRDLNLIESNAQLVLKHVTDLLDAAKLESDAMDVNYTQGDLQKWLREWATLFSGAAEQCQVELAVEGEPLELETDAEHLRRVVINILSNAMKFTPARGSIRLSHRRQDDSVVIAVDDSGPGIAPEDREKAFERFRQLDGASTRQVGGTGLGLAICRQLVTLLRGTIAIGNSPLGGARFIVTLPIHAPDRVAVGAARRREQGLLSAAAFDAAIGAASGSDEQIVERFEHPEAGTVLVCEDHPQLRAFLAEVLGESFNVVAVANGALGLERIRKAAPDVIVTDIMMPVMSGDQLVAELQKDVRLSRLPVLVLSARADEAMRERLLANGAKDYLNKPFGRSELRARVANLMTVKRSAQELEEQLRDVRRLHELSTRLIRATDLPDVLDEILAATVVLQTADFGHLQLFDSRTGSLRIVAQRGFSQRYLQYFQTMSADDSSAAGRALRAGNRVIIEDVQQNAAYEPHLEVAEHEGYRAVQSTPIIGRDGGVKGMLSTHFRQPHCPPEADLQLTDLYVRLAADLIERLQNEDSLRLARDNADRANRAKSRFLATASHDLRQPAQALSLLNGSLQRMPLPDDAIEVVVQQEHSILAMSRLLNALLDISKLESGAIKPQIQNFTLASCLEELRTEFSGIARDKGLCLQIVNSARCARSDPTLVGQILRNLVSNAIRYTRQGFVCLRCREEAATVRIEVEDSGIGIAQEHLPFVFDEFYQVRGASGTREGHGLGLSIVQRAARLLDHDLGVRSELGRGTTFTLCLPAGSEPAESAPFVTALPAREDAKRERYALVVDDDPAILAAMKMLLNVEGFRVSSAQSVAEAAQVAREQPNIEIVISDFHLHKGELGTQAIAAVRSIRGAKLSAVLLTGDTSNAITEAAAGVDIAVASKPVNPTELLQLVANLLAQGQASPGGSR